MATTTTITMARQERSPAPTMRLECPEVTSGLQLMITVQRPVAKAAKAWLTSPLSRPLMSRRTRRSTEPTMKRIREGAYTIDEIPSIKAPVQRNPSQFRISLATTWILWTVYLATRVSFILCSPTNEWSSWTAWATLIAETLLVAQEAFLASNLITPLFTNCRPQSRPRYHLVGRSAPSVDVCITCCGEPSDVILNTVSAAIAQDYPPERFRVFILDDGHSAALREAVQKQHFLSRSHGGPEILYRSRNVKPSTKSYFKAGNLQFGITEAKRTGDAEYFASLDADMIAEPDWLRSMLPHMILDSRVGLVNPPQNYYNVPKGDPLAQQTDLDVFFGLYEPLNDSMGAARCMGSGFVARHAALADIGGWPLIDVGEDFMLSSRFLHAGWKTAFIPEKVQFGLAPESMCAHVKQKRRWVDGAIAVHKTFGFYWPSQQCQMSSAQRIIYYLQALQEYSPMLLFGAMLLLPGAMIHQQVYHARPQSGTEPLFLRVLFSLTFLVAKINNYILHGRVGVRRVAKLQAHDVWSAPHAAARCLKSLLPNCPDHIFKPSGSITSTARERSEKLRAKFLERLHSRHLLFNAAFVVYAIAPFAIFLSGLIWSPHTTVTNLPVGPAMRLFSLLIASAVPLCYMAFPPTVPEWTELTALDGHGVRRPKKKDIPTEEKSNTLTLIDALQLGVLALSLIN